MHNVINLSSVIYVVRQYPKYIKSPKLITQKSNQLVQRPINTKKIHENSSKTYCVIQFTGRLMDRHT